ncbi:MAG: hypothetical protein ACREBU_00125 [Nitrososphaera sp.]
MPLDDFYAGYIFTRIAVVGLLITWFILGCFIIVEFVRSRKKKRM